MSTYCVYLTIYKGSKLPPFYIGYVLTSKISNGYKGTVKSKAYKAIWLSEIKNHPELFETNIIIDNLTREEANSKETKLQRAVSAHINPLYINRAINGEKFYRQRGEYHHSMETKIKIGSANSKRMMGKAPPNKGVPMSDTAKRHLSEVNTGKKMSEETKKKISDKMIGRKKSEEHRLNMSISQKGKPRPEGTGWPKGKPRSDETKKKISMSTRKVPIIINTCPSCNNQIENKIYCNKKCKEKHILTCPHCNFSKPATSLAAMKQWHFDNCKTILLRQIVN